MNASSWGTLHSTLKNVYDRVTALQGDVLFVQETRIAHRPSASTRVTIDQAYQQLRSWGWYAHFSSAEYLPTGHTSAGVGLVWKPHLHVIGYGDLVAHRAAYLDLVVKRKILRCCSYYGPVSGSLEVKLRALEGLLRALRASVLGYVVISGDFNLTPKEVAGALVGSHLHACVTGRPTCVGSTGSSEIDFSWSLLIFSNGSKARRCSRRG